MGLALSMLSLKSGGMGMCIMCVEIFKGRMSIKEGRKALLELIATAEDQALLDHYKELSSLKDEEFQKKVEEATTE